MTEYTMRLAAFKKKGPSLTSPSLAISEMYDSIGAICHPDRSDAFLFGGGTRVSRVEEMIETELDVLRDVSGRLESAGISFMLTGSVAMNYYAQPRMTRDIDLVVSLNETQAEAFFRLFETEYYFDRQSVAHAISRRRMFNLIHNDAVIKVDCVVLKTDAYRQEEFSRRRQVFLGDFETWIVSREDLILSKLFWAKDSKSEMQLGDVRNLVSTDCDMEYLGSRAKTLKVDALLEEILGYE